MSSGGSCKSQSMITHLSPVEKFIPAIVAEGCPNLLEKTINLILLFKLIIDQIGT